MARKVMTPERAHKLVDALLAKAARASRARDEYTRAFLKLKARPDWPHIANLAGIAADCDEGDLIC